MKIKWQVLLVMIPITAVLLACELPVKIVINLSTTTTPEINLTAIKALETLLTPSTATQTPTPTATATATSTQTPEPTQTPTETTTVTSSPTATAYPVYEIAPFIRRIPPTPRPQPPMPDRWFGPGGPGDPHSNPNPPEPPPTLTPTAVPG